MTTKTSCAFTGHRPKRYSFGYDEENEKCLRLKQTLETQIVRLMDAGITTFYSGMALAADQWGAEIVLRLKKESVRLIAVLPCETQAGRWSIPQQQRYFEILAKCDEVIKLNSQYTHSCLFERNRYLIDHAHYLLAVYDGENDGGTAYTVDYARQKGREIISIHPDTLAVTDGSLLR